MLLIQMISRTLTVFMLICVSSVVAAKGKQVIKIAYLTQAEDIRPTQTYFDRALDNNGVIGAEIGIEDNNTTGQYTKQQFILDSFAVPVKGDVLDIFSKKILDKYAFVITNLHAAPTLEIADLAKSKGQYVFDTSTIDDELRNKDCRQNMLHILPNRAMRADALAQYMAKMRWTKWFLVVGPAEEDKLFAEAIRRAAKRFGSTIVQEKAWEHTFEARRSAQADVAVFSQIEEEYDVLVVADEQGMFGDYLEYRTWIPRPIIGTQGMTATSWHKTHEQWGAVQMQNRFKEKAGRWMEERDFAAYLSVRAIGEAATRAQSVDSKAIMAYMLGNQFALQGYKGAALSFRPWDNQLRQPVLLAAPRALVAVAPIDGFMHPQTELDTLGYDQPETGCQIGKTQ